MSGIPFGVGGLELTVRPFVEAESFLQRAIAARPLPDPDAVANIRWGKPATFGFLGGNYQTVTTHVTYWIDPDDTDEIVIETWQEIAADVEEHRVENPDDSEQYVIEERKTASVFQRPDGSRVKLVFSWELPPTSSVGG